MSVKVFKGSVYAHESLSMQDIIDIIELSKDLQAHIDYYNPEHDYGTMSLGEWLRIGKNLVMAKGDMHMHHESLVTCTSYGQ